jgi:arsenite/tail-anchored protein-transporting ATPase
MTFTTDRPSLAHSALDSFNRLNLLLISGKGGVGKTTFACSMARQWAKRFPQETILLISTDPAHSLSDVLQMPVEHQAQEVMDLPNLQVSALNAEQLLSEFKTCYGSILEQLIERGSVLSHADLSPIWNLSWPGLDELMGLLEIQRLLRSQKADRIIVDMAPSGHTLNLFGLMQVLEHFTDALRLFQAKHRYISESLGGQYQPDSADHFLSQMQSELEAGRALLQNLDHTACWVVSIPEVMSLAESIRFVQSLERLQIPCGGIVVNRYQGQAKVLQQFRTFTSSVYIVPELTSEPIGPESLDAFMGQLSDKVSHREETTDLILWPEKILPSLPDFIAEGRRLVIVGGKGGVGKTSLSAAIGLAMTRMHPDAKVRIISIDPAHSLGDALGQALGHEPKAISDNLSAQEIDAHRVLDDFRQAYLWELADMISGASDDDDLQLAYGPEAWRQIVGQTLPGIDEMLSLLSIVDLLERDDQTLIVLDTAPTGHLLRFLEMPSALADWLSWIFKVWLKYQDVVGHTELISRLRTLRQKVMKAHQRLKDSTYSEFLGVVHNEAAVVAETKRLIEVLAHMGIHQRYLIHNRCNGRKSIVDEAFPEQMLVHLPELPNVVTPFEQVRKASKLLF